MIFDTIQAGLLSAIGNMWLVAIMILLGVIVAFVIIGLDFKWTIAFSMPLVPAFVAMDWLPVYVGVLFWFFIVGIASYMVWANYIHG